MVVCLCDLIGNGASYSIKSELNIINNNIKSVFNKIETSLFFI